MTLLSRRALLEVVSLGAAGALTRGLARAAGPQPTAWADVPARANVALLDGPLLAQFAAHHATLLAMNEDALLKPFRVAAGLPAPGEDLGGWYNAAPTFNPPADLHGYIPGHSFGQYVSSLARAYAVTGDERTRQKVLRLVAGFAPTISPRFYERYPLPAYTFDKLAIGLIDAYGLAKDENALRILDRALEAALPYLPERALTRAEMAARPHPNVAYTWDESYTLPENLYRAFGLGAGERYRELARRFLLDANYFDPLARGENVLPGRHAYSHVNALSSAMQAYRVDGNRKHLRAAMNGFDFVAAQSFATGGWGPNETFVEPGSGALGDSLRSTHASFETPCGAYGHFKIARSLLAATGDSRYGDSIERVLYNTVLGVLPMHADGTSFYYADYNEVGAKTYYEQRCPCCSGTLGQVLADYGMSSYLANARGIYVNLYAPSRFTWLRGARTVSLQVATLYPLDSLIELTVETAASEEFTVGLRVPSWAGAATAVAVNGQRVATPILPGAFHTLRRSWRNGDRIELVLDATVRLEQADKVHPDLLAVVQGPLALFAVGERFLPFRRSDLPQVTQTAPRSATWRVRTADGEQTFKPYFAIGTEPTRLYHRVAA